MHIDVALASTAMIIIGAILAFFGYAMVRLLTALSIASIVFYLSITRLYSYLGSLLLSTILAILLAIIAGVLGFVFYRLFLSISTGIIIATILARLYNLNALQMLALVAVFTILSYFLAKYIIVFALTLLGATMVFLGLVRIGIDMVLTTVIAITIFIAGLAVQLKGG